MSKISILLILLTTLVYTTLEAPPPPPPPPPQPQPGPGPAGATPTTSQQQPGPQQPTKTKIDKKIDNEPAKDDAHLRYSHMVAETTAGFWFRNGQSALKRRLNVVDKDHHKNVLAKNIILFVGDGLSNAGISATRVYLGGAEEVLSFETFPSIGLAKVYALDRITPDTASAASAYLSGVKARVGTIGVSGQVKRGDCEAIKNPALHIQSIAKWAIDSGKSTGFVTSGTVTDPSVAGLYAHVSDREWYNDAKVKEACGPTSTQDDIALQLIKGPIGRKLKVILGGGRVQLIDPRHYPGGERSDGRNLIEEYLEEHGAKFVETLDELDDALFDAKNYPTRLMGAFTDSVMPYNLDTDENLQKELPSLSHMTHRAIEMLRDNQEGFFLFVESSNIARAFHERKAAYGLDEISELSKAVEEARLLTDPNETLIIVTGNHLTLKDYGRCETEIFEIANARNRDKRLSLTPDFDGGMKVKPNETDSLSPDNGSEDVPVFAMGPWAHLFCGVYEQSTLPYLMGYASCLGNGQKVCEKN